MVNDYCCGYSLELYYQNNLFTRRIKQCNKK